MLFFAYQGFAQQQPNYFHSALNPYLINPAYAGEGLGQNMYLVGRNEFSDMPDAPKFYHLTFDAALSNPHVGFGADAFSSSMFAIRNLGVSASYRYKLQMREKHFLSMALSAGFVQNSLDFSKIVADAPSDISDFTGVESTMQPTVHLGLLYQYAQLKIGVSASHILSPAFVYEKSLNQQNLSYRLLQQYHLSAAYKYRFGQRWAVDAMVLGGSSHGLSFWGTVHATFNYDDIFWFGGGFGYESTSYLTAGLRLAEQLVCSYSYGLSTAKPKEHRTYLGSTHEICLGYRIQRSNSKTKDQRLSQEITQLQYIVDHQSEEIDRLKQEMARYQLDRETIDSLLKSVSTVATNVADLRTEIENKDSLSDISDTITEPESEDCFYVIIGATRTISNVKEFQKTVLKNFNIETKVLDPDPLRTYFFIYTDVFATQKEAQEAIKQLEKTILNEYLIGNAWIYQSTRICIEND